MAHPTGAQRDLLLTEDGLLVEEPAQELSAMADRVLSLQALAKARNLVQGA